MTGSIQFLHCPSLFFFTVHSTDVKLQQRIEFLSRAVMCAKSSNLRTCTSSEGEFLQELEEKLEVSCACYKHGTNCTANQRIALTITPLHKTV